MRTMNLLVVAPVHTACLRVLCAEHFADRLRGLLGREALTRRYGLWIRPCNAVHTFGMRFPIDLVFVDRHGHVLGVDAELVPGRIRFRRGAHGVLELAAGAARRLRLDRAGACLVLSGEFR